MQKLDLESELYERGLRDPITVRRFDPTPEQERRLQRIANEVVVGWRAEIRSRIRPQYADSARRRDAAAGIGLQLGFPLADLERALDESASRTLAIAAQTDAELAAWVRDFTVWHTARFVETLRRSTRFDAGNILTTADAEDLMRAATRRNVGLIRRLNSDMHASVERAVLDAWNQNRSARVLTGILENDLGFAPGRAKLIGRDQTSKLAGELDRLRMENLGIESFTWQHSLLPNPRPDHLSWHGRVFPWARPPNGVIPGEEIQCRCRAAAAIQPRPRAREAA